jgi:hypothetical protein
LEQTVAESCNAESMPVVCSGRFDELGRGLARLCEAVASMHDDQNLLAAKLDRLDESIRGSGTARGLADRVHALEEAEKKRSRLLWIVIGAVAVVLVRMGFGLLPGT